MGVVRSLNALILTRIGVGVFEAPCFPANSRILATWFPQHERARANCDLFVRPVRRPRLPERAAVLDHAAVRLARPVLHRRRPRRRCSACVWWALYRNPADSPTVNQAELDYIEAGGGGEYKGEPVRFKWRHIARAAAAPAGDRRVDRPVRRQLDAGVLRHLVSDLPRDRARDDVHPGRLHDVAAVHRRVDRRARRRLRLGHDPEADRIGEPRAQAADRRRHAAGVDDRRGQLRARRQQRRSSS